MSSVISKRWISPKRLSPGQVHCLNFRLASGQIHLPCTQTSQIQLVLNQTHLLVPILLILLVPELSDWLHALLNFPRPTSQSHLWALPPFTLNIWLFYILLILYRLKISQILPFSPFALKYHCHLDFLNSLLYIMPLALLKIFILQIFLIYKSRLSHSPA